MNFIFEINPIRGMQNGSFQGFCKKLKINMLRSIMKKFLSTALFCVVAFSIISCSSDDCKDSKDKCKRCRKMSTLQVESQKVIG